MKLSLVVMLLVAAGFAAYAQSGPRMTAAEPTTGKIGDVITVTGENLAKDSVAKVYLTDGGDGTKDVLVDITEQTATTIKFKIPTKALPGRQALMILTTTKPAQLIEQPVKITVDDGSAQ